MKSPNIGQHICGPDKESDKQSHDKWYRREGYQISWWVLKNFHVENKRYQKKGRHDKIKNISGTWGKRGRWGNATVVFETALKVILSMLIFFYHGICSFYWNLHYLCWTLKIFELRWITSVFFPLEFSYAVDEIEYYFTRTIRNALLFSKSLSLTFFFLPQPW